MWDMIWYLGFPIFAVGVYGAPQKIKNYDLDADGLYKSDNFDVIYDQRQNGTENYKLSVDGLSLVWSPNSLLAAAALLEPALYGEYPATTIDELFELEPAKPLAETNSNKTTENPPNKVNENHSVESPETPSPLTVLVIEGASTSTQKVPAKQNLTSEVATKRKLRLPGLLRPFLKKSFLLPENISRHN